ncbi:MAG: hypothetical protein HYS12_01245 [Planctomycetes bacterium]|nr:hypothetical protein [Planctomycetota bacterium]
MLILGAEIGMLVVGLIALFSGKFKLSKGRVVEGAAARVAGAVLSLPLPLAFGFGFFLGAQEAARGRRFDPKEWQSTFLVVELGLLVVCGTVATIIVLSAAPGASQRARRRRDAEEDDLDTPPVRPAVPQAAPARPGEGLGDPLAQVSRSPVRVACPECRAELLLPERAAGKQVRCAKCSAVFSIPVVAPPAEDGIPVIEPIEESGQDIQTQPRRGPTPPLPWGRRVERESPASPVLKRGRASRRLLGTLVLSGLLLLIAGVGLVLIIKYKNEEKEADRLAQQERRRPAPPEQPQQWQERQPQQWQERQPQQWQERPAAPREQQAPPPPITKLELPPLPDPVAIRPAPIRKETSCRLPEPAGSLRVGGGGRFLILHFPRLRKLGVFDANAAKIVRYINAPEHDVQYAGAMTKLVVFDPDTKAIQRYNLLTGDHEYSGQLDLPPGRVQAFCLGHASAGPLLVSVAKKGARLFDIEKFQAIPLPPSEGREDGFGRPEGPRLLEEGRYWAGATGRVFGRTDDGGNLNYIDTVIVEGGRIREYSERKWARFVMPGPDDHHVYPCGYGVVSERITLVPNMPFSTNHLPGFAGNLCLPAHHGPYYLHAQPTRHEPSAGTVRVYRLGDNEPIVTYNETVVCRNGLDHGNDFVDLRGFGIEHSLHLIPKAKLLVIVPGSRDELRLYPADLEVALDQSGRDFLTITSSAPATFQKGKVFLYQAEAKARKGPVTFRLEGAPKGMTVAATGLVRWAVPADLPDQRVSVILVARDAGGQEVFQTLSLAVRAPGQEPPQEPPLGSPPGGKPPGGPPPSKPMPMTKPMEPSLEPMPPKKPTELPSKPTRPAEIAPPDEGKVTAIKPLHVLAEEQKDWLPRLLLLPNGKSAVTYATGDGFRFWNVETGKEERFLPRREYLTPIMAITPDGKQILQAVSRNGRLNLWDLQSGETIKIFDTKMSPSSFVAISPDGNHFLTESNNRAPGTAWPPLAFRLHLWDLRTGKLLADWEKLRLPIQNAWFSADGKRVLSVDFEGVRVWEVSTGKQKKKIAAASTYATAAASDRSCRRVLLAANGKVYVWDVETETVVRTVSIGEGRCNGMAFVGDSDHFLSWTKGFLVRNENRQSVVENGRPKVKGVELSLWDARTGQRLRRLEGHTADIVDLVVTPDGKRALSGDWDGNLFVWDLAREASAR